MFRLYLRPRNPLVRLIGGIVAILAVAAVLALGVFALAALVVGGGLLWLYSTVRGSLRKPSVAPVTAPPAGIIDGEFTVIPNRPDHSMHR
ncbi:MAG: hypothetical protein ABI650_06340 [Dokdonella sp.]